MMGIVGILASIFKILQPLFEVFAHELLGIWTKPDEEKLVEAPEPVLESIDPVSDAYNNVSNYYYGLLEG